VPDNGPVLVISHVVAGATLGTLVRGRTSRVVAALASHALLDGIPHDDASIGEAGQAALGVAALAALALSWGPLSPTLIGGLAGSAPDGEIALMRLRRRCGAAPGRLLFPSHWKRRAGRAVRRYHHPYRFPGPTLPIGLEVALSSALCAGLCAVGLRRRSRAHRRQTRQAAA
jgi:hypothetical protein